MGKRIQVGVVGSATFAPRHHESFSLEEAVHNATKLALHNANIGIDDIDGIVVASCDQMDGRAIAIMAASGSVGGVSRDIMATPSSAEHAFVLGALRVRSGMYRTQLVVSWSPMESDAIHDVQRLGTDPYFNRKLPLDDLSSHALQANALEAVVPQLRDAAVSIVAQNRKQGKVAHPEYAAAPQEEVHIRDGKVLRWPLTDGMVAPAGFCVVAMVLASDDWITERGVDNPAWLQGMGWATEPSYLGDRDLATLPSLQAAAQQAYQEAGIDPQSPGFGVAEVADATPYQQLLALEGLGLCSRTEWVEAVARGDFAAGGSMPVNLSGGAISFNPVFCTGLMRINEAANQVRGMAGNHQRSDVKLAVAHGASGFAMQYNTVVVFGRDRQEAI